ncbi:hypothetical protein V6Z12_D10G266400 [Gossypium hirsutum]
MHHTCKLPRILIILNGCHFGSCTFCCHNEHNLAHVSCQSLFGNFPELATSKAFRSISPIFFTTRVVRLVNTSFRPCISRTREVFGLTLSYLIPKRYFLHLKK